MNRVKFDLFLRYGSIAAAAGDRHLAEFMPGDPYPPIRRRSKVEIGLTTVALVIRS